LDLFSRRNDAALEEELRASGVDPAEVVHAPREDDHKRDR
jgi:hypothetical protein